jgi:hypothetical protein
MTVTMSFSDQAKMSPVVLQLAAMKAMRAFYSLTAIAHYSVAIRDWVRDLSKAILPALQGESQGVCPPNLPHP